MTDRRTFGNWWRVRRFRQRAGRAKHDKLIYPHVLRYTDNSEFGCHSLIRGTTVQELTGAFDEARRAASK